MCLVGCQCLCKLCIAPKFGLCRLGINMCNIIIHITGDTSESGVLVTEGSFQYGLVGEWGFCLIASII